MTFGAVIGIGLFAAMVVLYIWSLLDARSSPNRSEHLYSEALWIRVAAWTVAIAAAAWFGGWLGGGDIGGVVFAFAFVVLFIAYKFWLSARMNRAIREFFDK